MDSPLDDLNRLASAMRWRRWGRRLLIGGILVAASASFRQPTGLVIGIAAACLVAGVLCLLRARRLAGSVHASKTTRETRPTETLRDLPETPDDPEPEPAGRPSGGPLGLEISTGEPLSLATAGGESVVLPPGRVAVELSFGFVPDRPEEPEVDFPVVECVVTDAEGRRWKARTFLALD